MRWLTTPNLKINIGMPGHDQYLLLMASFKQFSLCGTTPSEPLRDEQSRVSAYTCGSMLRVSTVS
jgi:hypothetical protein